MSQFIFHCGFPKTGSTSLQMSLSQSNINYLGFLPRPENGFFYKTDALSFFLEQVVRFGTEKTFLNQEQEMRKFLKSEMEQNSKATILSNENIIGRITPFDLPNDIKLRRAISVLPENSVIVIGTRKLESLLYSYYKLLLSNGYAENISYFFKEISTLEPAFGIIDSFRIQTIIEIIQTNRRDLVVRCFDISKKPSVEACFLNMGVSFVKTTENQSFDLKNIDYHTSLNASHYSGKRFLDWFEVHRVFPNADFSYETTYRSSRSRHLHNAAARLNFMDKEQSQADLFQKALPQFIKDISEENEIYLNDFFL